MKWGFIILTTIVATLYGCLETEEVSPIPEIEFQSFDLNYAYDEELGNNILMGRLKFSFIDGDADFGMYGITDSTSWDEDNYNVFLTQYYKSEGVYLPAEVDSSNPPPYYVVRHDDRLDRVGQNKTINGTITINLYYFLLPEYDTIRYDIKIKDRAGNDSNIESTDDISFVGIDFPEPQL